MSLAPSPTAIASAASRCRPAQQAPQSLEFGVGAENGLGHPAGEAAVFDLQFIGLVLVEAGLRRDAGGEVRKAARNQRRVRAARTHGLHESPGSGIEEDAALVRLGQGVGRQPGQHRRALAQRGHEVDVAAHRALGDPRDLGATTGEVGDLVDAFDADDGRVHVRDQEPLAPPSGVLDDAIDGCALERPAHHGRGLLGRDALEGDIAGAPVPEPDRRPRARPRGGERLHRGRGLALAERRRERITNQCRNKKHGHRRSADRGLGVPPSRRA